MVAMRQVGEAGRRREREPLRAGMGTYLVYWVILAVAVPVLLEGGSRLIIARAADPGLGRVVRDFPHLKERLTRGFRFIPDAELSYRLRPHFSYSLEGRVTSHNAKGFRGPHRMGEKRPGVFRIACIGASTTYGVGVVADEATYPALLERELQRSGLANVEVFNLGVGGYTTREVLANLKRHGDWLQPDMVIVQCAINDVPPRFYPTFSCDYRHFRKPLVLPSADGWRGWCYQSRFLLLAGYRMGLIVPLTLQDRTQPPWPDPPAARACFEGNGAACFERNLAEIVAEIRARKATPILLTQAYLEHPAFEAQNAQSAEMEQLFRLGLMEHNEKVRDLARESDVALCDIDLEFPRLRRHFTDPIHMTETGNAAKARLVGGVVENVLRSR